MKTHRKTFLRVLFLFAVLTCSGITVYSNYHFRTFNLEISGGTNDIETRFSSEVNASDDDQVYHSNDTALIESSGSEILVSRDRSEVLQFSCSVWQPPKIS